MKRLLRFLKLLYKDIITNDYLLKYTLVFIGIGVCWSVGAVIHPNDSGGDTMWYNPVHILSGLFVFMLLSSALYFFYMIYKCIMYFYSYIKSIWNKSGES